MLCEHCKMREATVKYVEVINGVKSEHNLCAQCASRLDIGQYSAIFEGEFPLGKLLSGLLGVEDTSETEGKYAGVVCPSCGTTYEDFVKDSQFGCPDCYSVFDPLIRENIKHLQGSERHVGKHPGKSPYVGTGLRASVVLHLPLLSRKRSFNSLVADMGRFGTAVRGVYGEGGENYGSLYQVSNQKTLGQSEKEIIELVTKAAAELDAQERRLRQEALKQKPLGCQDEVYKSYGVLRYARRLTRKDAMEFLSQIMVGVRDGILKTKEPCSIYRIMLGIQPANLLKLAEKPMEKEELEAARAQFVRAELPEIIES